MTVTLGLIAGLSACGTGTVGLPPPGSPGGGNARLFYPIAVALSPCGDHLYIANSNFDRAFNDGTLVGVSTSLFTSVAATTGGTPPTIPFPTDTSQFTVGLLDTFASNMVMSPGVPPGTAPCPAPASPPTGRLYVTTRNSITLSSAFVQPDGGLQCPKNSGGFPDCSSDAVMLGGDNFVDPYAVALAQTNLPGQSTPQSVLLVSHLSQAPTSTDGIGLDTYLGVIPEPAIGTTPAAGPSPSPFSQVSYTVDMGQPGSNSIIVGPSNEVIVGGCFLLVPGGTQVPCLNDTNNLMYYHLNPLRLFFLDAGPTMMNGTGAQITTVGLGPLLGTPATGGGAVTDMAKSSDGQHIYVATEMPDVLMTLPYPQPGISAPPVPLATIPLTYTPQRMLVLPRAGKGDLIAIAATESNAFVVVDPTLGTVIAQLEPVGNQPFGLAALPIPQPTDPPGTPVGYRVFVSLFNDCGVVAVDIPTDAPEQAAIRSVLGTSCVEQQQQMVLFQGML